MISKTFKIGLFVIALCSVSFINSQERNGKKKDNPEDTFKKLDVDANGSVSLGEFIKAKHMEDASREAMINKQFNALDTNTNGELTLEEFILKEEMSKEELMQQRFQNLDSDGNGSIDYIEFKAFTENNKDQRRHRKPRRPKKED
jgi:Ca2+-binding EF-hand superfamily protein